MIEATVTDTTALARLEPARIEAYLKRRGWRRVSGVEGGLRLWHTDEGIDGPLLRVPMYRAVRRYLRYVREVLSVLAQVEERSQLDVFVDLGGEVGTYEESDPC